MPGSLSDATLAAVAEAEAANTELLVYPRFYEIRGVGPKVALSGFFLGRSA